MTATRYLSLALLIPLLTACEPKQKPAKVEPEAPGAPAVVEPPPVAAPAPVAPAVPAARTQVPAVTPRAPATEPGTMAKALPKHKLDLSLPPEWVEQMNAGHADEGAALVPLLPPLFEEKQPVVNPFQLSGRLITNDADKDYWNSVEGAEVQFEFRQ
ncbi:hypothetical protein D9M68_680800 [compost metagenome]